ncbi:MAG TPA: hypothetical protein VNP04_22120 [Alphaproteobacteria bacterium]|nr:hypothetical protein [Alphaproteobacteria bacterium]
MIRSSAISNLAHRAVTFASFVFGGMDRCPGLKVCPAHGAGYRGVGIDRMDQGWRVCSEAQMHIEQPPARLFASFRTIVCPTARRPGASSSRPSALIGRC